MESIFGGCGKEAGIVVHSSFESAYASGIYGGVVVEKEYIGGAGTGDSFVYSGAEASVFREADDMCPGKKLFCHFGAAVNGSVVHDTDFKGGGFVCEGVFQGSEAVFEIIYAVIVGYDYGCFQWVPSFLHGSHRMRKPSFLISLHNWMLVCMGSAPSRIFWRA